MILLIAGIIVATSAGAAFEHRYRERALPVTDGMIKLLLYGLMPFVTFFVLARLDLHAGVGTGLALGYVELGIVGTIGWLVSTRVLHLTRPQAGGVVVCCILANTGYLGVPLNAALLGKDAIAPAIAWDVAVSGPMLFTAGFAVAAACGTKAGDTAGERMKAFLTRNPPLLALIAGLLAPDVLAPAAVVDIAREVAKIALLPLGFFVLGVHLAREQDDGVVAFPPPMTKPTALVLGLRLVVAPLLYGALALTLHRVPDAYRLQAAMPCGINALVAAHTYGLDLRLVAGAVGWATAVGVGGAAVAGILT